jgi:SAM-dependent methyltransferase
MQIDWRIKSWLFWLSDKLPPGLLYFAQKHVSGRSAAPIRAISASWHFHERVLREHGARTVLEFGAGKNLAQNIYLSSLGVSQTLVDLNPMLDLDLVNRAIADVARLDGRIADTPVSSRDELKRRFSIDYVAPLDLTRSGFPEGSFDACISTNTLEHIPREVIRAMLVELRRILRPGGIISAKIDYGDHYASTDRNITRGNYLRFAERDWARHNHANHYQNRMRHGHYAQLAREAGFEIVHDEAFAPASPWPSDLRPELLCGDGNDHKLAGYYVWRAPAAGQ